MSLRLNKSWLRLTLLNSLLVFSVAAGADVNQFDRNGGGRGGDNDGGNAEGGIGGGPRGGGNNGGNHGGNNGGGRGDNGDNDGGNADGGWGDGRDRGDHGNGRGGRGGGRGGRGGDRGGGGRGGNQPDPNPYDPNPGHPGRDPRYPDSPCQRDPRYCPPGNGGGWGQETERTVYVNQVFQQQYVDLNYLAGGVIGNMRGYGLTGIDVEILNQWGPTTLRLIVNSQQVDAQNVFNRYVSLNSYQPIDLQFGNRVSLGVQGRVHVGSITLHFVPFGRR